MAGAAVRAVGVSSSPELPPQQCVDVEPLGAGWGWDGSSSCRIDAQPSRCIDTDPVGDGRGWNGSASSEYDVWYKLKR